MFIFDNYLYRIVEINNGNTKLIKVNALMDNNANLHKKFASSIIYGKEGNTESDDYWDYYLNHTWYNNISSQYQNMLVDDTYYLGHYDSTNYKMTICKDNDLDSVTTKNCTKYTSSDADKIFIGKVGLARAGEMFASQLKTGEGNPSQTILINPMNNNYFQILYSNGYIGGNELSEARYAAYPTITIKSTVKITSGTGYYDSPFEISE